MQRQQGSEGKFGHLIFILGADFSSEEATTSKSFILKLSSYFEDFTSYVKANVTFSNTFPDIYIHCKVCKDLYKL